MMTVEHHMEWLMGKSKRRLRNEDLLTRPGHWLRRLKFYRAWKPVHEEVLLKQRQKQNPTWGMW